ncbi:hypothetical protein BTA51_10450 [Hahella sp. CCB-MM4]|nr:hypothetical protein BTA51_10450 [Hahella sp. CCB-MM4]
MRAAAILLVILAHGVNSYGSPDFLRPLQTGGVGVDLFFVLSGWLLGSQLFKELNRTQHINVSRFWIRRWMRTLPAYYVVLVFTVIQLSITKENFEFPYKYFVFIQNYDYPLHFFSISWSLCVEEQFYLAIAPLLLFSKRLSPNAKLILLLVLLVVPSIFRELEMFGHRNETHVRWDCCIMGVMLAHIYANKTALWEKLVRFNRVVLPITIAVFIGVFVLKYVPSVDASTPSPFFLSLIFGSWVLWAASPKPAPAVKAVVTGVNIVSTRSYSMYLLHPEALAACHKFMPEAPFVIYMIVALAITMVISEVLHRAIELPFMNLRERFKVSQSKSHVSLNAA